MAYIGTQPTKVVSRQSANVYRYEATAGQTAFTGADLDNNVLACNPADLVVHMNGLRLESTDYTATSTTVTLTTAATAGDEVTVTSFVTFEVADTYTKTAADDRYVNTTGDTMTGNLGIGATNPEHMLHLKSTGPASIKIEADSDNSNEADNAHMEFSQDGDRVKTLIGYSDAENAFKIRSGEINGNGTEIKMYTGWNLSDPASAGNEALTINNVGQTRLSKQPRAWMSKTSADSQTVSTSDTSKKVTFGSYTATNGMSFSNTNDRLTVPSTGEGEYFISVMVAGSVTTANVGDGIYLSVQKNGSNMWGAYSRPIAGIGSSNGEEYTLQDAYVVPLNGSDYLEVLVHGIGTTTAFTITRARLVVYAVG